jgi:CheY-like chemotaxis protein
MMASEQAVAQTVLIVDDEPVNRLVLGRMVEHLGAHPIEVASGVEALDVLAVQAVDLILMDIHMPQMSGIQTVERLRACAGPNQETPVVAVTGDTMRPRSEYLAAGFDGYANKPISLALVQKMLTTRRACGAFAEPRAQAH